MKVSCLAVSFLGCCFSVSTNRYVNWGSIPKHFAFLPRLYHIRSVHWQFPNSNSSQWPTGDFLLPGPTTLDPAGLGVLFPRGSTLLPRAQQELHNYKLSLLPAAHWVPGVWGPVGKKRSHPHHRVTGPDHSEAEGLLLCDMYGTVWLLWCLLWQERGRSSN